MPLDKLQGVWRIEESRGWTTNHHVFGTPNNSHWLVLGDRGIPFRELIPEPLYFEFRIVLDEKSTPATIHLLGENGGAGFFELTEDLLIVTIGRAGVKPPRFEFDCGNYFAFTRDRAFDIPQHPTWCRREIKSPILGTIAWNPAQNEWNGVATLDNGKQCEIWATDDLMPISQFLPKIESVFHWLCDHLVDAKSACAESVIEWTDEMPGHEHLTLAEIIDTISVDAICANNGRLHCWASTTIPIDHSIRLWLEIDGDQIRPTGASIEG